MQMRPGGVPGGAADAQHLAVRDKSTTWCGAGLYCHGAHVPVISIVAIGMVQTDIDAEIDLVILRVPPARIDDPVCIRRGIHGAIRDAIVHAVVTIVIDPIAEAIRPVCTCPRITHASARRRRAGRRGRGTILARLSACKRSDDVVVGVVGGGMIENGFLGSRSGIRRIKKRRDDLRRRDGTFRRGAAHTEEESTEQEGCEYAFS